MPKTLERFLLFMIDFILINLAFFIWARWRWAMGFFVSTSSSQLTTISMIIYVYWLILFLFYGLYHIWYTRSRVDEFISVLKVVSIGLFLIFILTFDLARDVSHPVQSSRMMILVYWILMVLFIGTGRGLLRSLHHIV